MRTHPTRFTLVAMMGLSAALAGCPVYWGDGGDPCRAGRCGGACESVFDCGPGELCAGGRCVTPPSSCRTHGDCPVGTYCGDAECVLSDVCTSDARCTSGMWCDFRGTCTPHGPGDCRSQSDCGPAQLCIENRCVDVSTTCQLDRECPGGQVCLNNECTRVCSGDAQCATGDRCVGSFCRATTNCSDSSSCESGEHCVEGRCLVDCRRSGSCNEPGTYCAEDGFCRPTWERTPFCTRDTDCADERVCRDGVCRTPCPSMADAQCMSIDAQLPLCRRAMSGDYLCFAASELTPPECRTASDCSGGRDCVNGQCRAR